MTQTRHHLHSSAKINTEGRRLVHKCSKDDLWLPSSCQKSQLLQMVVTFVLFFSCAHMIVSVLHRRRRRGGGVIGPVSSPWLARRHTRKDKAVAVGNKVCLLWKECARSPDIWGGFNPSSYWILSCSLIKSPPRAFQLIFF